MVTGIDIREGGAISSAGQCRIMLAKKILHGVSGELRITSALPILGGHRVALGCSGLHANGCFNACRNCPAPKNLCRNSPALPYYAEQDRKLPVLHIISASILVCQENKQRIAHGLDLELNPRLLL